MKWVTSDEAYTRSTTLSRFDQFMAGSPIDYRAIMDEVGLPREALKNRNLFISHERYGVFFERLAKASGDGNLGLRYAMGLAPDFPNFGSLVQLARFCTSLRDWIERASRLAWLQTSGWLPHLEEKQDGLAHFRIIEGPVRQMPRQQAEGVMTTLFMLVRELVDDHSSTPLRVCFRHDPPADQSLHRQVFDCELQFGCSHNGFVFEAQHLDRPIVGRFAKFRIIFDIYVRAQVRNLVRNDISVSTTVSAAITNLTGTELCTAERVAELLGLSEKKMQRLLRAEGTSFRTEALKAREKLAMNLLARTSLPIGEIARVLGYGSGTAFSLAFSKLTQQSPSEFRASHEAGRDADTTRTPGMPGSEGADHPTFEDNSVGS